LLESLRDKARAFALTARAAFDCSAEAWCTARKKLAPEFVRRLVHQAADAHDARFGAGARHGGRRVFAVDGSKFNTKRSDELRRTFGSATMAHCPQVLVSTLFNLYSLVPHDLVVAPYATSERVELLKLLPRLRRGDVLVLDRGYPSFEVLCRLRSAGIDFVVRVPRSKMFPAALEFERRKQDHARVDVEAPRNHVGPAEAPVPVRILRSRVPGAGPVILVTSLSATEFPVGALVALYRRRWEIEEYYKVVKSDYLGAHQFHALSASGVTQEIYAAALFIAATRYLMSAAAAAHGLHAADLSPKAGILAVAEYLVRLLVADGAKRFLADLLRRLHRVKEPKREGRSCPRRSFKPSARWGPKGKRGS
jgi:hypothetical protein